MTYVLDTNAVSALMKGSALVVERLAATEPADVAVPQPVLAELGFGIERLPRSRRRTALQARFNLLCVELPESSGPIWSARCTAASKRRSNGAVRGLRISMRPSPRTPSLQEATLVTADLDHMTRVPGLRVEDWNRPRE